MGIAGAISPPLPPPRGPITEDLFDRLASPPDGSSPLTPPAEGPDPWGGDCQLALYVCYELHYRGFSGVAERWEWDARLLSLRASLEEAFLGAVREELGPPVALAEQLEDLLIEPVTGTGPSSYLLEHGRRWQAREYLAQRSLYHLKEADPQAWAIPRLHGRAQAALVAIEFDEYGGGRGERVHSRLFAEMMHDLGLDAAYGGYVSTAPAPALAVVNLMSLFGLHREHRGALVGQFAGLEITSSPGSRRLVDALERLGAGEAGTRFYREHIEADAVHEQLVRREVIGALLEDEPDLEPDIAFGLAAGTLVDERLARHAMECWRDDRSSLLVPLPDAPARAVGVG